MVGLGRRRRAKKSTSQYLGLPKKPGPPPNVAKAKLVACAQSFARVSQLEGDTPKPKEPVSYTHLTLPTICSV
eukprot:4688490-Prymnesium_polylepis.1